ncbi:DUF2059 domain-containing protein [Acinetobacter rathckeae]|uniref:DUF2059 domain-containing protein n=1 Tax=Acinetobacter rathckeae TaxID=2605272 RepID=UPI0018A2A8FC|nr:DUF2059 domain-containing protein [Acinetobacter rathckeae]MBF7696419.1 DUF2059 domain-containing protein [Acinetobacter rathckeae]
MQKKLLHVGLFALATTLSTHIYANSPTQELISLTNASHTLDNTINSMVPIYKQRATQMVQQRTGHNPLTAKDLQVVDQLTQSMFNTSQDYLKRMNMLQSIEGVYATYYTDQEIQAYLKFLKSPEGRSIMSKNTQVNAAVEQQVAISITNLAKSVSFQQKIAQDSQSILAQLPTKK